MNEKSQRVAIAKACGWTIALNCKNADRPNEINVSKPLFIEGSRMGQTIGILPDYTQDLNAMHEAEKILTHDQHIDYMEWLGMCSDDYGHKVWAYVHATAAQRAEAFLKTLNLWT